MLKVKVVLALVYATVSLFMLLAYKYGNLSIVSPLKMSDEHTDWGWFGFEELKDIDIEDNKVKKVILDFLEQI